MKSLLLVIAITGCGTSASSNLLTKGMSAEISATTTGDGTTHVGAELFEGNPDQLIFVDLQADDVLVADSGTDSATLAKSQLLNIISYDADLDTGSEGDEITVALDRSVDAGAPSSIATLPAPFTLDPVATTSSRAAAMTLTYAPAGSDDDIRWQASGDCIQVATGSIPADTGSIDIAAATIVAAAGSETATCQVTLTVSRVRGGTLDAHFEGGTILGEQARSVMFSSTP